jgi:hypothetical protein
MSLKDRLSQIEKNISMNPDLFKEKINFENMSDLQLEDFIVRELNDEVKQLKNLVYYHGLEITDGKSFVEALSLYASIYCSDELKKFYSPETINDLGELFNQYRDRIII